MVKGLLEKLRESAQSVLPIGGVVLALHFTLSPMPLWTLLSFLAGMALLIVGMSIFTLGADIAMLPIGESIGSELAKSRSLPFMITAGFILGVVVTIAEPDLQVLTKQVPAVPDMVLVASVAVGVGAFLVLALLRIVFQAPLRVMFLAAYALVFIVAAFTAPDFLAVGFDSGGVTTGPITVPFILAMGAGVSTARGGRRAEEDSFGLCALCSIGPVLAVLIMGMSFDASASGHAFEVDTDIHSLGGLLTLYQSGLARFFQEVAVVLLPIVVIFLFFHAVRLRLSRTRLIRILAGILYTLAGLTLFLTGVNIGFMPAGTYIGHALASLPHRFVLLPLSAAIGFFIVFAEPAVHVLTRQVETVTSGTISQRMMLAGLAVGVSLATLLSVVKIFTGLSIWLFLLPGYGAALTLAFFTPKLFMSIAFDSGGVAAGSMTAAFLLPFAVGICDALGKNIMTDAFGIIAMVAMLPLLTIQCIGLIYERRLRHGKVSPPAQPGEETRPAGPEEE